ncbi:HAD-IIA family hydrolase [Tessaracoccus sp. SD287]|uniref:HAD-IIA family hydrolase n=1 Tax=Tessaracoccus sp. SD287 TaxID=2782008 RepID=UPI001A95A769|nr:HAD-IIA family hydrolase [Tessaracoccus sp. SD287]MBO1031003.1 HAD-IIA family hydrolase [Tessaracoccus sp. SD287]
MSQAPATAVHLPQDLYDAYVFDMDGTVYLGDHLLPGAARMINELRRRGIGVRFLSNNPTKDPEQYATKLAKLGLPTDVADIANTVVTTAGWLKQNHPNAVLFPIAEEPLCNYLRNEGFELSDDPEKIDIVIASYDRTFDYRKLQIAFDALWFHKRAILVQTNPDKYCPFPGGRGEPDCASIVAAIEASTGVKCQANFGKPDPIMLTEALRGFGVTPDRAVMVGDRLGTDIKMAVDGGMTSALVLTGDSTLEEAQALADHDKPTYILDRVDQLIPQHVWDELGWTLDND